jgi:hypothetical protein
MEEAASSELLTKIDQATRRPIFIATATKHTDLVLSLVSKGWHSRCSVAIAIMTMEAARETPEDFLEFLGRYFDTGSFVY